MQTLRFVFAIHNHQPVGNFDDVFESAYRDSYLPFLDLLDNYPHIPLSLHISGPLLEWLLDRHEAYVGRLRQMLAAGRLEILGGGFYEPILPGIPSWDRRGQIRLFSQLLEEVFGCPVRGMWVPERVWEQSLVRDIAAAGIEYTVLDDFHFRCAGLSQEQLFGYYLTEDEGCLIKVFPNSERLRYLVPWRDPEETVWYLREVAERCPNSLIVCADDGEKFGGWAQTHKHVFENGWLQRFFDALSAQADWLRFITFSRALDEMPPAGTIYLPEASYREMTEWALPIERLAEYEELVERLGPDPRWPALRGFIRGGLWRNFKLKYPETHEMYCRMLEVSRRLYEQAGELTWDGKRQLKAEPEHVAEARRALYRAQCNCSYWHGAFGGAYLPHLRHAVYSSLIRAETELDLAEGTTGRPADAVADDFNLDARIEVRMSNRHLTAYFAPAQGGQLYELDLRQPALNLLATMSRRPEPYHKKMLEGSLHTPNGIGARPKIEGLEKKLVYDPYRRRSLIDHFFPLETTLQDLIQCRAAEQGDFATGVYQARIRRSRGRVTLIMTRLGSVDGHAIRVSKSISLADDGFCLQIDYQLQNLPAEFPLLFAVELAFAGLAARSPDRLFYTESSASVGGLEAELELHELTRIGILDTWLGLDIAIDMSRPGNVWTFPIETVNQSEGGPELVYQSSTVLLHWRIEPDEHGRWSVSLALALDTAGAKLRWPTASIA